MPLMRCVSNTAKTRNTSAVAVVMLSRRAWRTQPGRAARHHALNDCIFRALQAPGIPATKEPSGLVCSVGKRPYGGSLIP